MIQGFNYCAEDLGIGGLVLLSFLKGIHMVLLRSRTAPKTT